jgi:predicted homoserine dehydrogenase-like protein
VSLWQRLRRWADEGNEARVAVAGAGFVGRGLVYQLQRTPGMRVVLLVNRSIENGLMAYELAGRDPGAVVVSDHPKRLSDAVDDRLPALTSSLDAAISVHPIDVVVEATGALDYGARVVLHSLEAGKDVVSYNAELDATLAYQLHHEARRLGCIYTIADGDQPAAILRMLEFVSALGLEITAAVNCKRNLDVHQNPDSSRAYASRDRTSLLMTTAFGDGTKMNIENAVVANLTGLIPDRRGMHGVQTTLERAAEDIPKVLSRHGVVEYTLGGDFGAGVGVVGYADDPVMVQPYMRYYKMGDGPHYFFFRPYHLAHLEFPLTIAELVLDRQPIAHPAGPPVAEVVAVAKRDLQEWDRLDGIGGYACYGQVDTVERAKGLLPVGLAKHARITRAVAQDEPIPLDSVELDETAEIVALRRRMDEALASLGGPKPADQPDILNRRGLPPRLSIGY